MKWSATLCGLAAATALPLAAEVRLARAEQRLTDRWRDCPVAPRSGTSLGISFRPRQAEALGLDSDRTLDRLLGHPFDVIRLGAYWNRMDPHPGELDTGELDRHIAAAERAGKQIILCVGAVKTFGYPEFFVPPRHLRDPLPEGTLITPATHPALLTAATGFVRRVVHRYRDRDSIVAWQIEHDAVDPLGMEHSWRLGVAFVRAEVDAVREADPARPVLLNGFLPTSLPVRAQQWWRTRDQGDSLDVARELADIVGIDSYPRHALATIGSRTLYLDGADSPWQGRLRALFRSGREIMVTEGQAEPWETVTDPPNPRDRGMYSCLPEQLIRNYNRCMAWPANLSAYLFWGAEYWVRRDEDGDPRYLRAFARVLDQA